MQITKLQENQIDELVKTHKACVMETNAKAYSPSVIAEWLEQINTENVLDQLDSSDWIIATEEGKMLGFAQYLVEDGYLYQINVHPDFQGKHIGKKLYEYIEEEFIKQGAKEIKLNASLNAVPFYQHMGFEKLETISFSLEKEELEMVLMSKKL